MIKKMMLLAMAVGALVAFAVPAVASAAEWTHQGLPLEEKATVLFNGPTSFTSGDGSVVECPATADVTLEPGTTGVIDSFAVANPTAECTVKGGLLGASGCKVETVEATTPWTIHAEPGVIKISGIALHNKFAAGCLLSEITLSGSVIATPDDAGAISSISLSGNLNSALGEVAVNGNLEASPAGTYGVE